MVAQGPIPAAARERLTSILGQLGLSEAERQQTFTAVERKFTAYRAVQEARRALMRTVRQEGDTVKALAAYQEALKQYAREAEKIDRDLNAALHYTEKARLQAGLISLGVLGDAPAAPLSALLEGRPAEPR
jgi:hypothetical protein